MNVQTKTCMPRWAQEPSPMQGQNREATCEPLGHTSYNKNGSWMQSGAVYQSVGLSQSTDACDLELIASLSVSPSIIAPLLCLSESCGAEEEDDA